MSDGALDRAAIRAAYRTLCGDRDPAGPWLAAGASDARFGGLVTSSAVLRGADDLIELHDLVDDLFGPDALRRPASTGGEVRRDRLALDGPAAIVPFLETLRPSLEHRGPAFWTWKSAREALARRLVDLEELTLEAVRVDA